MRAWSRVGMLLLLVLSTHPAAATEVHATVDRDTVHLGDTVTLNVTVKGAIATTAPDFSVLLPDFILQGRSRKQDISISNGQIDKIILFAVALKPRRVGTLSILPLAVAGGKTKALSLTVLPATAQAQGNPGDDVYIHVSIKPQQVYVGQQAVLSVQLYYDGDHLQGQLDEPAVASADLQQLGKQTQSRAQRGGRLYQSVERRYALIPRQAGTLHIAPIDFQGQMIDRNSAYRGFFGAGRNVRARSADITLQVRAKPAAIASADWLPARNLDISMQGLPANGQATAGVPITLTLTEQADGLRYETLPELSLPDIAGAEVYPDKAEASTGDDGQWLQGKRVRKFAIVPTRSGDLRIPAIAINWWDVQTDQQATATTKAHVLQVAPAAGAAALPAAASIQGAPSSVPGKAASSALAAVPSASAAIYPARLWQWLAGAALGLWLLTGLGWWLWPRHRQPATAMHGPGQDQAGRSSGAAAKRAFMDARDGRSLAHALLHWARVERPQLSNLGQLCEQLDDPRQRDMIVCLQQSRFADNRSVLDVHEVQQAFKSGFAWHTAVQQPSGAGLPPLYPSRNQ